MDFKRCDRMATTHSGSTERGMDHIGFNNPFHATIERGREEMIFLKKGSVGFNVTIRNIANMIKGTPPATWLVAITLILLFIGFLLTGAIDQYIVDQLMAPGELFK